MNSNSNSNASCTPGTMSNIEISKIPPVVTILTVNNHMKPFKYFFSYFQIF